jgi:nitrogen-specific signal transduction histidine kinase
MPARKRRLPAPAAPPKAERIRRAPRVKLKTKLSLSISLLVLVLVLAISVLYLSSLINEQVQDIAARSDLITHFVFAELRQEMTDAAQAGTDFSQPQQLDSFLKGLAASSSLNNLLVESVAYPVGNAVRDVAVVNQSGIVVADSDPQLVGSALPPRPPLDTIARGGLIEQLGAVFGAERTFEVQLPLYLGVQKPFGSIRLGLDTALMRSMLAGHIRSLLIGGILTVLVSTFLAVAFSDFALSPLAAISAELDRVTGGPASPDAVQSGGRADEYGVVSSKIRQLGRQIQDVRQVYTTLQESVTHVLESLEEGLLFFDATGHAVMASAAAQRFLGLEPANILRRSVDEIFPSDSSLDRAVREAVAEGRGFELCEVACDGGNGTEQRRLLARMDIVGDPARPQGRLLVLRDAEGVRRLEDEIEVARRLSAVGRLTRGVAHEVKNPLNAMAIHLELLREKARSGAPNAVEPHAEVIRREIDRLDSVVKTFLDFTRPLDVQLRRVDLVAVVEEVRQLAAAEAAVAGMEIVVHRHQPTLPAWIAPELVQQALLNLVTNGLQAMADAAETPPTLDGRFTADAASSGASPAGPHSADGNAAAARPRRLTIEVGREAEQAVIRVHDRGRGVPADIRDKIFDLYFTTKPEGSGIGLSLTARVMQVHNGSVELEETSPWGSTFALRFPLHVRSAEAVSS